jgi:hypothetical protein
MGWTDAEYADWKRRQGDQEARALALVTIRTMDGGR